MTLEGVLDLFVSLASRSFLVGGLLKSIYSVYYLSKYAGDKERQAVSPCMWMASFSFLDLR